MRTLQSLFSGFDFLLFATTLVLTLMGLVTMYSFESDNAFFSRQVVWILLSVSVMFAALIPDYRFLRSGNTSFYIYLFFLALLILVLLVGEITLGAQSRFDLGLLSFQPSDPAKIALIILLSKYFSKRHEMIGDFRHIVISRGYTLAFFCLVFVQPDFGSAIILFFIWFGMILVAGIKFRHLFIVFALGAVALGGMWQFAFADYQKERIVTFLDPL